MKLKFFKPTFMHTFPEIYFSNSYTYIHHTQIHIKCKIKPFTFVMKIETKGKIFLSLSLSA